MSLAPLIDHTLLRPEATPTDVERLVAEASEHRFCSVCVYGHYVPLAARLLDATPDRADRPAERPKVCTVIGFPHGASSGAAKQAEAAQALEDGAQELDMVLWIGGLLAGDHRAVADDIGALAERARQGDALLKVILETGHLSPAQLETACHLAVDAGAHFVKTSTGFGPRGASLEDIRLMRANVPPAFGVKASGGIRTRAQALALVDAGATRLGTSGSLALLDEPASGDASPSSTTP